MAEKLSDTTDGAVSNAVLLEYYGRTAKTLRVLEDAQMRHAAEFKRAKAAGVDAGLLKFMHRARKQNAEDVHAGIRAQLRALDLLNMPMVQGEMFAAWEPPDAGSTATILRLEAEETGYASGREGAPRDANPHPAGSELAAAWDEHWHEGTAALAGKGPHASAEAEDAGTPTARQILLDPQFHGAGAEGDDGEDADAPRVVRFVPVASVPLGTEPPPASRKTTPGRRPRVAKPTHPEGGRA